MHENGSKKKKNQCLRSNGKWRNLWYFLVGIQCNDDGSAEWNPRSTHTNRNREGRGEGGNYPNSQQSVTPKLIQLYWETCKSRSFLSL